MDKPMTLPTVEKIVQEATLTATEKNARSVSVAEEFGEMFANNPGINRNEKKTQISLA
ncbi:MAG TPA: hypothetical protein VFE98_02590 [Candidatus Bathyarchaeia archaeon]|nr:hypothetical protein [Candidatus Bathyarchaeia archaeon]